MVVRLQRERRSKKEHERVRDREIDRESDRVRERKRERDMRVQGVFTQTAGHGAPRTHGRRQVRVYVPVLSRTSKDSNGVRFVVAKVTMSAF